MNPHTLHFESRPRQKKNPFIVSRSESWKRVLTIIIKVILAFALIFLTIYSFISCSAAPPGKEEAKPTLLYISPSGEKMYHLYGPGNYAIYFTENIHGEITNLASR